MPRWGLAPVSPRSVSLALPDRVVTNAELCEVLDTTPEWIEEKTGIRERRFLGDNDNITELAVESADRALALAGLEARDVDVLVVASTTPDWLMPSLGVIIADRLGIASPRIVDITQHACASSVYAIYTAACLVQEPGLENALVVCAEGFSRATGPYDRTTRIFFGDAAAAAVFSKTEASAGLLSYDLGNAFSDAVHMASPSQLAHERAVIGRELHSQYLQMDGRVVLREASTRVPKSIAETLAAAGVEVPDVSGFALHQASARLVRLIGHAVGADPDRVAVTADALGNTGAASPLTALRRLAVDGRAGQGDLIVLGAIGAGFLWGSMCFKLPNDISVE
ncbi:ketoacyl-ACP synthase III [Streptomyces sp. NBC_01381]|uniref:3-oxoacyl-ACP synthase III family protein n=1 Tax=unclassified Streptomyces TaxID=2593676 RepID=UPI002254A33B|nr:ketoacyl-ACP synthase III [Streptomyces sp. NBC_01381]MCX4673512.1 ketoacyl-ACP synthase III [Streptomyces sp. NBC_01381]